MGRAFRRSLRAWLAVLLAAGASNALADGWDVRYDGPDELALIERPNSAGRNLARPGMHVRKLREGRLELAMEPIIANAAEHCAPEASGAILVKPATVRDRIGDTASHMSGIGYYLNLPDADRVQYGNFYLAPFFALSVSFKPEGGPAETAELFEFKRLDVDARVPTTQDKFIETDPGELMPPLLALLRERLPAALKHAFPKRCAAA
jgi:hypothetical protein